jgi:hypothetical protein
MSYYECKRCFHKTNQKIGMIRHLSRKKICTRDLESYKYAEKDLEKLSLTLIKKNKLTEDYNIIYEDDNNSENNEDLEDKNKIDNHINLNENIKKEDSNISIENKEIISITNIKDNNIYCNNCNKYFTRRSSLQRHVEKNRCKNIIYTPPTEQNITNITNNTIIINVNLNKPLPFDSDWDVSKIDDKLKNILVLSDLKYTKTLEHILENDVNLNIIIEDKAENGIVYKNDVEKFKLMKVEDIVDLSMNKLHKQLTIFHDEIKNNNTYSLNNKLLLNEKESLDEKYNNFKNENDTKILVKNYIADIYNKQKDRTLNYCKDVLYDEISKIEGY